MLGLGDPTELLRARRCARREHELADAVHEPGRAKTDDGIGC